jgi:hypothetical protein
MDAPPAGTHVIKGTEESLLMSRARKAPISLVVFFFGVLMSTAVIQLYMVSCGRVASPRRAAVATSQ